MTKLGVLAHGSATLGYPFNKLFTECVEIKQPADLFAKNVDAVVLWGGEDISPELYGEQPNQFNECMGPPTKRDLFEWNVLKEAVQLNIPIIGVCRGAQLMCAFDGGKLAQDVAGHQSGHGIHTFDNRMIVAPANHHQMMLPRDVNELLAWSSTRRAEFYIGENNTIHQLPIGFKEPEAVFFPEINGVGFQFHPEWAEHKHECVTWALDVVKEKLL